MNFNSFKFRLGSFQPLANERSRRRARRKQKRRIERLRCGQGGRKGILVGRREGWREVSSGPLNSSELKEGMPYEPSLAFLKGIPFRFLFQGPVDTLYRQVWEPPQAWLSFSTKLCRSSCRKWWGNRMEWALSVETVTLQGPEECLTMFPPDSQGCPMNRW